MNTESITNTKYLLSLELHEVTTLLRLVRLGIQNNPELPTEADMKLSNKLIDFASGIQSWQS